MHFHQHWEGWFVLFFFSFFSCFYLFRSIHTFLFSDDGIGACCCLFGWESSFTLVSSVGSCGNTDRYARIGKIARLAGVECAVDSFVATLTNKRRLSVIANVSRLMEKIRKRFLKKETHTQQHHHRQNSPKTSRRMTCSTDITKLGTVLSNVSRHASALWNMRFVEDRH